MNPEWLRTEVWHALSVHFPLVLLLWATLVSGLRLFTSSPTKWLPSLHLILIPGVAFAWWAIYTGNLADGIVGRQLCDPTVLKQHENLAWYTVWIYTAALLLHLIAQLLNLSGKTVRAILFILTLCGAGILGYVGHLGGSLVYDQGAGVSMPDDDCTGF